MLAIGWTLVVGCGKSDSTSDKNKAAILRVMKGDQEFAKKMELLPPNSTPSQIAWAVGRYCNDLEQLDASDCPPDFRVAFKQHGRAWRDVETALKQLPDRFLQGVLIGAVNAMLRGEKDGGVRRLEGDLKRALERVRTSWEEVEKIGAKHGVAL